MVPFFKWKVPFDISNTLGLRENYSRESPPLDPPNLRTSKVNPVRVENQLPEASLVFLKTSRKPHVIHILDCFHSDVP